MRIRKKAVLNLRSLRAHTEKTTSRRKSTSSERRKANQKEKGEHSKAMRTARRRSKAGRVGSVYYCSVLLKPSRVRARTGPSERKAKGLNQTSNVYCSSEGRGLPSARAFSAAIKVLTPSIMVCTSCTSDLPRRSLLERS